jgi:hypothetical protein
MTNQFDLAHLGLNYLVKVDCFHILVTELNWTLWLCFVMPMNLQLHQEFVQCRD